MGHAVGVQELVGRERESRRLDAFAASSRARGAGLLLRGPAGIGKSFLLGAFGERVRSEGGRVLTTVGVPAERRLPFAALHRLLRPVLEQAERLPPRQRDALLSAFGMGTAVAPDPFLIALAALELIVLAARQQPVLAVVDDAQWLDQPSAEVLAFVASRIADDPVLLVVSTREGYDTPFEGRGLAVMELGPLDDESAGRLLDSRAPHLGPRLRSRLLDVALGNPLALVELAAAPRAASASQAAPLGELPMATRLERAFTARAQELPQTTQTLLLIAAADDGDSLEEVLGAARRMLPQGERDPDALLPAVEARLLAVQDHRLEFRHPLVRSAIYQGSNLAQRRVVHTALAEVVADEPDRRAWHRAAASFLPDEDVAAEVEAAADRAQARGGRGIALQALERSAHLTPDPGRRAERLLRAAELALQLGEPVATLRLRDQIDVRLLGRRSSARFRLIGEAIDPGTGDPATRARALLRVADETAAQGDRDLALRFTHLAALQTWITDVGAPLRTRVIKTAEGLSGQQRSPLLLSIYSQTDPQGQSSTLMARALETAPDAVRADDAYLIGAALNLAGAFSMSPPFLSSAAGRMREEGRLRHLVEVLCQQAWSAVTVLDWATGVPAADEGLRLARETEQPVWESSALAVQAMLVGIGGDVEQAEELVRAAEAIALPMGANSMLCGIQLVRGITALSSGRHDEAFAQLHRLFQPADPAHHHFQSAWALGDYAEAAVHTGHLDAARSQVATFDTEIPHAVVTWPQVGLLYARALVAGDGQAEEAFHAALDADLSRWPLYRGRVQLSYGRWLRRQRRPADARGPLRAAREAFDALGARAFAEQARTELRASGERSLVPKSEAWRDLSPQELQIARLAADGLSNREIAARLYLSHRTVGSHLYRVYPKLNVTSRAQLRDALGSLA